MSSGKFETENFDIVHPFGAARQDIDRTKSCPALIDLGPTKGNPTRGWSAGTHITMVFLPLSFFFPRPRVRDSEFTHKIAGGHG